MKYLFLSIFLISNQILLSEPSASFVDFSVAKKPTYILDQVVDKMAELKHEKSLWNRSGRIEKYSRLVKALHPDIQKALIEHTLGKPITFNTTQLKEQANEAISQLEKSKKPFWQNNENFSKTLLQDLKELKNHLSNEKLTQNSIEQKKDNQISKTKLNKEQPTTTDKPLNPFIKNEDTPTLENKIAKNKKTVADLEQEQQQLQRTLDSYNRQIDYQKTLLDGAEKQMKDLEATHRAHLFQDSTEQDLLTKLTQKQLELQKLKDEEPLVTTSIKDAVLKAFGKESSYQQQTNLIADIATLQELLNIINRYHEFSSKAQEAEQKLSTIQKNKKRAQEDFLQNQAVIKEATSEAKRAQQAIDNAPKKAAALDRFAKLKEIPAR